MAAVGECNGRFVHGLHGTSEYTIWKGIKDRCFNKNSKFYKNYGGRGIVVCDRWRNSFAAFLADMGRRPPGGYTIERINNDGDYEPDNCRWATRFDQARNTRANRLLTFRGESKCMAAWAGELGINLQTLSWRINEAGWSVERALSTGPGVVGRNQNG